LLHYRDELRQVLPCPGVLEEGSKLPLFWTIESRTRTVTVIAAGCVRPDDFAACLQAIKGAGAIGYRKLFDGRGGAYDLSEHELAMTGAAFRGHHEQAVGALALVLTAEQTQKLARLLGILAVARRPMRIFSSELSARRWLQAVT